MFGKDQERLTPEEKRAKSAALGRFIRSITSAIGEGANYFLEGWRADVSGGVPGAGGFPPAQIAPPHRIRIPQRQASAPQAPPTQEEPQDAASFAEMVGVPSAQGEEDQGSEE